MSDLTVRYQLDKTGTNPDNIVIGELHTLNGLPNRVLVPRYGAYYTESVSVYDNLTNLKLKKSEQFLCLELVQEATLRYGKEICTIILITDPNVSNDISINYQVVGGNYQSSVPNLITLYEAFINDNRPVDWTNVINKPYQYNPALHYHLLGDMYGWENIVDGLDRISRAITLSNIPEYESLIDWINSRFAGIDTLQSNAQKEFDANLKTLSDKMVAYESSVINEINQFKIWLNIKLKNSLPAITREELESETGGHKYVTYEQLNDIISWNNRNSELINLSTNSSYHAEDMIVLCTITTENVPDGFIYFYTIDNIDTTDDDFANLSGSVFITNNTANFTIRIKNDYIEELDENFTISLRKYSTTGKVVAKSTILTITDTIPNGLAFRSYPTSVTEDNAIEIKLSAGNIPIGTMYHYNIIPVTTNASDFYTNKGTFFVSGNKASFMLEPRYDTWTEENETFYITITDADNKLALQSNNITLVSKLGPTDLWVINDATGDQLPYIMNSKRLPRDPYEFFSKYNRTYALMVDRITDINTLPGSGIVVYNDSYGDQIPYLMNGNRLPRDPNEYFARFNKVNGMLVDRMSEYRTPFYNALTISPE